MYRMSYSYAYQPKVANPHLRTDIIQMRSDTRQTPFFFGGSQVPTDLFLAKSVYSGSSGSGFHRGVPSLTMPTDLDTVMRTVNKTVFSRKGHNIKMPHSLPHRK